MKMMLVHGLTSHEPILINFECIVRISPIRKTYETGEGSLVVLNNGDQLQVTDKLQAFVLMGDAP